MKNINKNSIKVLFGSLLLLGLGGYVIAATYVGLGDASTYAVLAGSTITNTGSSVVTGDLGLSPGSAVTGFPPGVLNGTQHVSDTAANLAKTSLVNAYDNAVAQPTTSTVATELGGTTKFAGVYDSASGTFGLTGILTLDAQGDANAVFIFKTSSIVLPGGSTIVTAGASTVSLINGAQACNVFWQAGSSATLGANSTFKGNILALTSITLTTGANVEGSLLARNGAVTLDGNVVTKATCVTPPPAPAPVGGSGVFAPLPLINVTKIPSPLALPSGQGPVTYTYKVKNVGVVPMIGIWVKDNKCPNVTYVSGDINNDSKLGLTEVWTYTCTKTVTQTETNIATAHGQANGWDGYDTANATVVVGLSTPAPLINIEKVPSVFTLPYGGGPVTYKYTVTNPGVAPLSDVSVIDDKCTGLPGRVLGHPGDLNHNDILESNETWTFTCQTNLTQTTTNIGTAQGSANGLTAIDFSPATVIVAGPGLPATGYPTNTLWTLILASSALVGLALLGLFKKKIV